MVEIVSIPNLPAVTAIYARYGGTGRSLHVAYVGLGKNLRSRIEQHLVRRDSSVTTGVSAVCLNPDLVTEVRWWEHLSFHDADVLKAAELVAFDCLDPTLRSRGGITDQARELYSTDDFAEEMGTLFNGEASGRLILRDLLRAWEHIDRLEERVAEIERRLDAHDG